MMQTEQTNIPPKHVNAKGSVGGKNNDDANKNIPSKRVKAKGSVGGRKRSGYYVIMMQQNIQTYLLKYVKAKLKEEKEMGNDDAYKHTR